MPISRKRILITGGTGFIGMALAHRLAPENEITLFDNGHRDPRDGIGFPSAHVRVVRGDVLDAPAVRDAVRGQQVIIHLASIANVDTVMKMPVTTMKVALLGTYNVLEATREEGCIERFIDFSTSEVFGTYAYNVGEGDVTTLGAVGESRWTYAVSKLATEHLAHNYHREYGLPAIAIRPFNIYGPGQIGQGGAIRRFILRALKNEDLEIHNDGSQIRAWCYIDDIVDGVEACLMNPDAVGHTFNIGNPRSVCTIYNLAQTIVRLSGATSRLRFVEWNNADIELRIPNISKARRILRFEPKIDLEEGLSRTIDWFRSKGYA